MDDQNSSGEDSQMLESFVLGSNILQKDLAPEQTVSAGAYEPERSV